MLWKQSGGGSSDRSAGSEKQTVACKYVMINDMACRVTVWLGLAWQGWGNDFMNEGVR